MFTSQCPCAVLADAEQAVGAQPDKHVVDGHVDQLNTVVLRRPIAKTHAR